MAPPVITVLLTPWGWAGAGIEYVVRIQPSPITHPDGFYHLRLPHDGDGSHPAFFSRKELMGSKFATGHLFALQKNYPT
jgi:hypothetical protein